MASLYKISIISMIKSLENASVILTKATDHITAKSLKPEEFLNFRLIEDMRPLSYQIQTMCNTAKFLVHRVGGVEDTYFPDDETTFEELKGRIAKTIDLLKAVDAKSIDGKEDQEIIMATKNMGTYKFTGTDYVTKYAIPNFHFHFGTAYAILRHLGVPIGAFDYLDTQRDLFVKAE